MNTVEPRKGGCLRLLVQIVVGGFIGIVFSKLILGMGSPEASGGSQTLFWLGLFLLFVPFAYWLVILVHEVGHVTAGNIVGFKFCSFIAGPLRLQHKQGRIRLGWNRSVSAWGGLAVMAPTVQENLRKKFIVYILGGPVASLLLTMLGYALFQFLALNNAVRLFAGLTAAFSALIFVSTSIPYAPRSGFKSDGRRIFDLLKGGPDTNVELVGLNCMAILQMEEPASQFPIEEICSASKQTTKRNLNVAILKYFAYLYHESRGDMETALNYFEEYLEFEDIYPPGLRGAMYSASAFVKAFFENDLEAAKQLRTLVSPSAFVLQYDIEILDAAIAVLEGHFDEARQHINATRHHLVDLTFPGLKPMYERRLDELERRCGN